MSQKLRVAAGAAFAIVLAAGPVLAQQQGQSQFRNQRGAYDQRSQQGFSRSDISNFFQSAEQTLTQAVQNGNPGAIRQWTQQHVADGASFTAIVEPSSGRSSGPKSWSVIHGDKQDFLSRQRAIFNMAPDLLNAVENYDLSIRVRNVQQIAENVAIVRTRISERGTVGIGNAAQRFTARQGNQQTGYVSGQAGQGSSAQGAGSGSEGRSDYGQSSGSDSLSFSMSADCEHVLARDSQRNVIEIGMTTCQAEGGMRF